MWKNGRKASAVGYVLGTTLTHTHSLTHTHTHAHTHTHTHKYIYIYISTGGNQELYSRLLSRPGHRTHFHSFPPNVKHHDHEGHSGIKYKKRERGA